MVVVRGWVVEKMVFRIQYFVVGGKDRMDLGKECGFDWIWIGNL